MILHHVGIAVIDMEEAKSNIEQLFPGTEFSKIVYDKFQDAFLCLASLSDGTILELVSGEKVRRIALTGFRLNHLCFETDHFDDVMREWSVNEFDLISEPQSAILFGGRRVSFWRTQMGLVELLEAKIG